MDIFMEQLVEKKATGIDYLKKYGFAVLGLLLAIGFMTVSLVLQFYLFMVVSAIILYFVVINLGSFGVEYEYIITNKEIDIDKISGKKKRKRLITLQLDSADFFGTYNPKNVGAVNATVIASDGSDFDQYLLVTNHRKLGKVALVFSPNAEFIELIKKGLPISLVRGMHNDN